MIRLHPLALRVALADTLGLLGLGVLKLAEWAEVRHETTARLIAEQREES